jgi:nicotinamidase-related amidase
MATAKTALIVVDMLNPYEHEDADKLVARVEEVVPAIRALLDRARGEGVDAIWVNDNYGDWNSSQRELVQGALDGKRPDLVEPIAPEGEEGPFVIKARHTIFYGTPLEYLLAQMDIERIVLTGQVTEQCILYSALDAYVREIQVAVPRDAVACIHPHLADAALEMMELNMDVDTAPAEDCELS